MTNLKKLQTNFLAYLFSHNADIADLVADQGKLDRYTRLDIYKNAYTVRLAKCIENDHAILAAYLGDTLFDQLTKAYIAAHPSDYTSLRQYCDHLPAYLTQHEPFKSVPVLTEIAHFERSILSAFDAADVDRRATIEDLQQIDADNWPTIQLQFHPSVFIFEAHWNSISIWQALKEQQTPPTAIACQDYWLIWRGLDRLTQFRNIPPEAHLMFNCFKNGDNLAEICEFLLAHLPEDQIGPVTVAHLKTWLQLGMIHTISNAI